MLDIKFIRENLEKVRKAITDKLVNANSDHLIALDEQRRKLIIETEALRSRRNEIADKLKESREDAVIDESKKLKEQLGKLEIELEEIELQWTEVMLQIPNIPLDDVPVGKDETENKVISKHGDVKKFKFEPKDHLALGEGLGLIDVERAAKISGTRFGFWKGDIVRLQTAFMHFLMSELTNPETVKKLADSVEPGYSAKPFIPVLPPVIIKPEVYTRTGRLSPQDKDDKYHLDQDDLYLIGSAEHSLVAMHMDEVISEQSLPLRYLGFSTAFRRESGSYGKDTRGMLRVHQFDKLEMESFTTPENSLKEHKFFVAVQEYIMQSLGLPYQLVLNCTGDMGKPNARQVDVETWFPGQDRYRETHSADYMTDFQARRLNIKYKKPDGSSELVHTNDATAVAQRLLLAIMENNQQEDGSILIPEVLQKYLGKKEIKKQ